MGLYVFDDDGPIKMMPKFPSRVHHQRRRTAAGLLPGAEHRRGWWLVYSTDGRPAVRAWCKTCGYTGTIEESPLVIELAADALAGHAEHRLTR